MLRPLLLSIALSVAGAAAAAAETREVDNLFRFEMPTGWHDQAVPVSQMKLLIASPRVAETGGRCTVVVEDMPELQSADQDALDAAGEQTFTDEFWHTELGKLPNATIEATGKRRQGGRLVQSVRLSADFPGADGAPVRVSEQQDVHLVPGRMLLVTCAARVSGVAREEDDFKTIMTSFEPIVETPTAALQPNAVPSLTLYDGVQFSGVSRVVTQDTSDLARFGWTRPTASLSIAGGGAWQVCDGTNFTGRCLTLRGSASSLPAFTAASVRHVKTRPGNLAAVGAVRDALKAGLAAAAAH
ncbi:MAG: hypothetical protein GC190_02545 [Alphaproteobacteria bacterium]|nr:hypothetical protein [Alphaproteobacteria bacterium]